MVGLSRRELLIAAGSAGVLSQIGLGAAALTPARKFRFVHMTDLHIQPELGAPDGVALAVRSILALRPRPDFVLIGGDHFMDMLACSGERKNVQLNLVREALKPLELPVHSCVGNHDVYGWSEKSAADASDPDYGKKILAEKLIHGPTYYSFDHQGWHFVILDSIQAKGRDWTSGVDDTQLNWLKADLEATKARPTVVMSHMPLVTSFTQYWEKTTAAPTASLVLSNGKDVVDLIQGKQVKAVLQGHTHIVEATEYLGTQYITGGAVCGEWWKGPRLGVHPEGYMVYDVDGSNISHHYVPTGWIARKA